jgi:membrane protein DedA with SNARE-associated domain
VLASILSLTQHLGYPLLVAVVGAESMGVPLPGETALILGGLAASEGRLSIVLVIVLGAAAAIVGDNIGFQIGRRGGRVLLERPGRFYEERQRVLAVGDPFFERHGPKAVFLGRWIAGLRVWASWLAGASVMSWRSFLLWNALGGIGLVNDRGARRLLRRQGRGARAGADRNLRADRRGAAGRGRRPRALAPARGAPSVSFWRGPCRPSRTLPDDGGERLSAARSGSSGRRRGGFAGLLLEASAQTDQGHNRRHRHDRRHHVKNRARRVGKVEAHKMGDRRGAATAALGLRDLRRLGVGRPTREAL